MNKYYTSAGISFRIWLFTSLYLACATALFIGITEKGFAAAPAFFITWAGSLALSIPAPLLFLIFLPVIKHFAGGYAGKIFRLLTLAGIITSGYGFIFAMTGIPLFESAGISSKSFFSNLAYAGGLLFACSFFAIFFSLPRLLSYFSGNGSHLTYSDSFQILFYKTNTDTIMEQPTLQEHRPAHSNRLLIKGLITGGLILLMLIPTLFIQNLVTEREERQKEVVKEVSSKWAGEQTLSGPFLVVPYSEQSLNSDGKTILTKTNLIVSAEHLSVNGKIIPEERPRSIYKVLLYKTVLNFSGSFKPQWPAGINASGLDLANAKLCFSLSDFKGIEEEVRVNLNNRDLLLNPGLPVNDLGEAGLSVPADLSTAPLTTGAPFTMQLRLKGSGSLHFIPMSVNSSYSLSSAWPSPSFDGNALPTERTVRDSGFISQWNFNRANLSFASVVKQGLLKADGNAFGVSMVQPADQYNKTMRSIKYAILIIGLSFALFFIIEIMQKKPFHPVQYVLTGLALVIFYTLLLSISEYILFDRAYTIAAAATVLLIVFYAKSHFGNWRAPGILAAALSSLYGFVFILISLEDTALLVGSIGLFIILALVMYASRKISWYGSTKIERLEMI